MIHYGIPEDIETYVQQVGQAGRDGETSYCTLFTGEGVYRRFCKEQMKLYSANKEQCRRDFLYRSFVSFFQQISTSCLTYVIAAV